MAGPINQGSKRMGGGKLYYLGGGMSVNFFPAVLLAPGLETAPVDLSTLELVVTGRILEGVLDLPFT